MAVHTDQLNAMTHEKYWPEVKSQVTTETPFMTRLFKNATHSGSGVSFKWTAAYKMEDGQWYAGYEILDKTPIDEFRDAELDWRNFTVPCSISGEEEYKNAGPEGFHKLLKNKMKLLVARHRYYLGRGVFQGGGVAAKEWHGLYLGANTGAIAELPTSRAYAGVTAGTDDTGSGDFTNWWQNYYIDGGNAALDLGDFTKMIHTLNSRGSHVSIIPTTFAGLNALEVKMLTAQRFVTPHPEIAKIGYTSISLKGIPVVGDVHCYAGATSGSSAFYFIDESDLIMEFVKGRFMKKTPWMTNDEQDARVMRTLTSGVFVVPTPRLHGIVHSVLD